MVSNLPLNIYEPIIYPVKIMVCPLVSLVGFMLHILCYLVFSSSFFRKIDKEKFKNYELYYYLRVESIFIGFNLFFQTMRPIFLNYSIYDTLASRIYELYVLSYFAGVLEMSAILCHILSTVNFFIVISNRNQTCFKHMCPNMVHYNRLMSVCIFLFSFVQFSYINFSQNIIRVRSEGVDSSKNETHTEIQWDYAIRPTEFGRTVYAKVLEVIAFVLRDVLVVLVLIVLNLLIYVKVNKSIKYKKTMLEISYSCSIEASSMGNTNAIIERQRSIDQCMPRKSFLKLEKAKITTTVMVICTCINNMVGKLPICVYYVVKNFYTGDKHPLYLFEIFAILFVYINYCGCFFIYYYSNKSFKLVILKYFKVAISKLNRVKPSK